MKTIILCADDYGLNPDISNAIIDLANQGRLSATSCITNSPLWQSTAPLLQTIKDKIQIGLHFNLTEGDGCLGSIHKLLILSHLRLLSNKKISAAFKTQYQAFVDEMGCAPDYIDGHQHIHHLPIIREVLLTQYREGYIDANCYFRSVAHDSRTSSLKDYIIQHSGVKQFKNQLQNNQIAHNPTFSGIYDFTSDTQYNKIFPQFLDEIGDKGLIMCHPGNNQNSPDDPIAKNRYQEYCYFNSDQFISDCTAANITLARK